METRIRGLRQGDMPVHMKCEHPDCKETHAAGPMYIHAKCHPDWAPWTCFRDGMVLSICSNCQRPVAGFEIAVKSAPRIVDGPYVKWKTRSDLPKHTFWIRNKCKHQEIGSILSYETGGKLTVHCAECDEVADIFEVAK